MKRSQGNVALDLVIQSMRTNSDPDLVLSLIEKLNCIEWREVLLQAIKHGVHPLLLMSLESIRPYGFVPDQILIPLRQETDKSKVRIGRILEGLNQIFVEARFEGLHPVLFKGLSLGTYYGDIRLRPTGDIDLLVAEEEIIPMVKIAYKLGYSFCRGTEEGLKAFKVSDEELKDGLNLAIGSPHLPPMIRPESSPQIMLDIHPNVVEPPIGHCFDVGKAIKRSQETEINGIKLRVLDPVDALLAYALNFYRDVESIFIIIVGRDLRLSRYCDIHEMLLRSHKNDLCTELVNRATTAESRLACAHALSVTEDLFPGIVAENPLAQLVSEHPDSQFRITTGPVVFGTNGKNKLLGTWSRDVLSRAFDPARLFEVLPLWLGLGDDVRSPGFQEFVNSERRVNSVLKLLYGDRIWTSASRLW